MKSSTTSLFLVLVVLPAVFSTHAFARRHEHAVDAWQPLNYSVSITLNDGLTEVSKARAEITVRVLKDKLAVVDLDFGDMSVDALTVDGKPAQFERTQELLNVRLAKPVGKGGRFVIAVEYHGKPKDGLVLGPDKDGKPSATGDNWPNRVHHWIPCLDHPSAKATVTFTITAPSRDLVVANGGLNGVQEASQTTRTWTYSEGVPIPAYCMVIAAGEYACSKPAAPAITPLWYYVPQSDAKLAAQGFSSAAPALKFYSDTIARYPYEKLALIVGATRFGGMENSSAIVFASTLFDSQSDARMSRSFNIPERLEDVVAHEIAHQWFGDSVTESSWSDLWLSEGFATYFAGLFIEKYDGEEAFRAYMKRAADSYFAYEKKTNTPIHDTETEDLLQLLNANNYQKGAWVLHMLRKQSSDEAFFKGLRDYYNTHKDKTATSDDLRAALERASGRNLQQFFARWVYGAGHPQYEFKWRSAEFAGAGARVNIVVKQTQSGRFFPDPIPIEVTSGGVKKRFIIRPNGKITSAYFRLQDPPTAVSLDPDVTLLQESHLAN